MRLLPVIRLSLLTDDSTSPERQFDKITKYAVFADHELVPITEADYDLDISGSVSPFDRPGLGRWLKEDRLGMWDALVVAKLDRISRSLFDFVSLLHWLEAHGKTLIVLDPLLDLSTKEGRAMANVLMTFAQYEKEVIGARVRDAHEKLVQSGQYAGGMVPYGYRPVKLPKGWGYEVDPAQALVVKEMARRYLDFESMASIAKDLRERGIPSPKDAIRIRNAEMFPTRKPKEVKGTPWSPSVVRMILSSPTVLGMATNAKREIVRDEDGIAVYRADGIITRDEYERIAARLSQNAAPVRVNTSPLLQVAFCGLCGAPMHSTTTNRQAKPEDGKVGARGHEEREGGYSYTYYRCYHARTRDGQCDARNVKAEPLESLVYSKLLEEVGHVDLVEDKVIPGRDYSEDIAKVIEQISHLGSEILRARLAKKDTSQLKAAHDRAEAEFERLSNLEPEKARIEPVRLGKTFAQHWETLDVVQRCEFLQAQGVRAEVRPIGIRRQGKPVKAANAEPPKVTKFTARFVARDGSGKEMPRGHVFVTGDDMEIRLYLGNLARLRDLASTV